MGCLESGESSCSLSQIVIREVLRVCVCEYLGLRYFCFVPLSNSLVVGCYDSESWGLLIVSPEFDFENWKSVTSSRWLFGCNSSNFKLRFGNYNSKSLSQIKACRKLPYLFFVLVPPLSRSCHDSKVELYPERIPLPSLCRRSEWPECPGRLWGRKSWLHGL